MKIVHLSRCLKMLCSLFLHPISDYARGFGGKFGVEKDRQDKSAAGWDEKVDLAKHESQKGSLSSFYSFRLHFASLRAIAHSSEQFPSLVLALILILNLFN